MYFTPNILGAAAGIILLCASSSASRLRGVRGGTRTETGVLEGEVGATDGAASAEAPSAGRRLEDLLSTEGLRLKRSFDSIAAGASAIGLSSPNLLGGDTWGGGSAEQTASGLDILAEHIGPLNMKELESAVVPRVDDLANSGWKVGTKAPPMSVVEGNRRRRLEKQAAGTAEVRSSRALSSSPSPIPSCPSSTYLTAQYAKYATEGEDNAYERAVDTIDEGALFTDYEARTDANYVGAALKNCLIVSNVSRLIGYICRVLGEADSSSDTAERVCAVVESLMEAVQLGFDTYYDQGGYHDTMIDYAETEASQANTEALLSDLCLIADATRCYPVEGARRGHGCDGLDSNCNGTVDEDEEDGVAPTVFLAAAFSKCGRSSGAHFPSAAEAEACVREHVYGQDDCAANTDISISAMQTDAAACGSSSAVSFQMSDGRGNDSPVQTLPVYIDGTAPAAWCSFESSGSSVVVIGRKGDSTAHILFEDQRYSDVRLKYGVTQDECDTDVTITLSVFSDENISDYLYRQQALFYAADDDAIRRDPRSAPFGLVVDHIAMAGCQEQDAVCLPGQLPDGRVYTVEVQALDQSGNRSVAECKVHVNRSSGQVAHESAGRFAIVQAEDRYKVRGFTPRSRPAADEEPSPSPEPVTPEPSDPPTPEPPSSSSCSSKYQQCGGTGWKGPKCCEEGSTCRKSNPYYSQCV